MKDEDATAPDASGKAAKIYLGLRKQILGYAARNSENLPEYMALMMDWATPNWVATIVAGAEGSASIYLSNGGGFIGGGQKYATLRNCAMAAIDCAKEVESLMAEAEEYALPRVREVSFYLVKRGQVLTAKASESDIRENRSPFTKLGNAAMAIMTEYRLITTNSKNPTVQ